MNNLKNVERDWLEDDRVDLLEQLYRKIRFPRIYSKDQHEVRWNNDIIFPDKYDKILCDIVKMIINKVDYSNRNFPNEMYSLAEFAKNLYNYGYTCTAETIVSLLKTRLPNEYQEYLLM